MAALIARAVTRPLSPDVRPGEVVLADRVYQPGGPVGAQPYGMLLGALRARGITVHTGAVAAGGEVPAGAQAPLVTVVEPSGGLPPAALSGSGTDALLCVVTEDGDGASAVRRSVEDAVDRVLSDWAALQRPREVSLAAPRSFCAGVDRAIEIVERALDRHGAPVYVRKQIVHNQHVVEGLARRGAVFVEELDEVPAGAVVVFSAHGVSPAVREAAERHELRVIDATCPLVTKVHTEARRFAGRGDTVVLIGHAGHEEVEGTLGEAPDSMVLVQSPDEVAELEVEDPAAVSYLMQTTLAMSEASAVVSALADRFPSVKAPSSEDICYASTNRQNAVATIAARSDLVLVVGSANSSNSVRLVELSERAGTPARLVDDASQVSLDWLHDRARIGITAGASAPDELVQEIVGNLSALGPVTVTEHRVATENVTFQLPKELRGTSTNLETR
ncbi:4-hydroxy-3-methylbut-2-enyl diphosphate reductase [Kitasatospora sp. NPDC101235]|uniref:4-hydroxy-3-methylbut-2-enyl diphosphate reductase n=1 Tax=Kitasatospora sp. NPDC101235 TaxID=3364101 RepID=UPI00382DD720